MSSNIPAPRWLTLVGYVWLGICAALVLNPWTGPFDYLNGVYRTQWTRIFLNAAAVGFGVYVGMKYRGKRKDRALT